MRSCLARKVALSSRLEFPADLFLNRVDFAIQPSLCSLSIVDLNRNGDPIAIICHPPEALSDHIEDLFPRSLNDSPHEIVRGMCAWSLGRLGGTRAKAALEACRSRENDLVREEIDRALDSIP